VINEYENIRKIGDALRFGDKYISYRYNDNIYTLHSPFIHGQQSKDLFDFVEEFTLLPVVMNDSNKKFYFESECNVIFDCFRISSEIIKRLQAPNSKPFILSPLKREAEKVICTSSEFIFLSNQIFYEGCFCLCEGMSSIFNVFNYLYEEEFEISLLKNGQFFFCDESHRLKLLEASAEERESLLDLYKNMRNEAIVRLCMRESHKDSYVVSILCKSNIFTLCLIQYIYSNCLQQDGHISRIVAQIEKVIDTFYCEKDFLISTFVEYAQWLIAKYMSFVKMEESTLISSYKKNSKSKDKCIDSLPFPEFLQSLSRRSNEMDALLKKQNKKDVSPAPSIPTNLHKKKLSSNIEKSNKGKNSHPQTFVKKEKNSEYILSEKSLYMGVLNGKYMKMNNLDPRGNSYPGGFTPLSKAEKEEKFSSSAASSLSNTINYIGTSENALNRKENVNSNKIIIPELYYEKEEKTVKKKGGEIDKTQKQETVPAHHIIASERMMEKHVAICTIYNIVFHDRYYEIWITNDEFRYIPSIFPLRISDENSNWRYNYLKKYFVEQLSGQIQIEYDNQSVLQVTNKKSLDSFILILKKRMKVKGDWSREIQNVTKKSLQTCKDETNDAELRRQLSFSIYVDYLIEHQCDYQIIDAYEVINSQEENVFIFSMEKKNGSILVIYENINFARATEIFETNRESYLSCVESIFNFFTDYTKSQKRLNLKKKDIPIDEFNANAYYSIDHDNLEFWVKQINSIVGRVDEVYLNFSPGLRTSKEIADRTSSESEVPIHNVHVNLVKNLYDILCEEFGHNCVGTEIGIGQKRIDMVVKLPDNKYDIYEIKSAPNARACVREALGQILDYAFFECKDRIRKMLIVGEEPITDDVSAYLQKIRNEHRIEIYYESIESIRNRSSQA
jgi:hypothetical protein